MATRTQQSQLHWYLPLGLFVALILATINSWANESIPSSNYVPAKGQPFFLLTDSSFSGTDTAKVRLEVPGRDYAKFELQDYGGIDMTLYRVPQPLEFLKKQPNLHRIELAANYQGEGLSNTLSYLWDNWYRKSRRAWQRLFSYESRKVVISEHPQLKMGDDIKSPSEYRPQPQFEPIKGLDLIQRFRYPIWDAKAIEAPKNAALAGSSSGFTDANPNNFYIPLGVLKPGLYVVEATIANFRANALVFVTDTVAITKITNNQMMVWTADRNKGSALANVNVLWTDGTGILQSGKTDSDGAVFFQHESPEQSYVLGEDENGSVFVSENFYYDSEVYSTQLYTFTDRPLYRPGDSVEIKSIGRQFLNARESTDVKDSPATIAVLDPTGTPVFSQTLNWKADEGLNTHFVLPENAVGGGYDIRLSYGDLTYNSSFRVAEYIKPHFEIHLTPNKPNFKTGEPIEAAILLTYPDGKPVANGHLQLTVRAQVISMVNGEMRYMGQFPVELSQADYTSDSNGKVAIALPAAEKPSRYVFTIFANDGAAYRVKSTQELLIERGAGQFTLKSSNRLSQVGETVNFNLQAANLGIELPAEWQWIRLEDQVKKSGDLNNTKFDLSFDQSGHYSILLLDNNGNVVGSLPHRVIGSETNKETARMEITFDQPQYKVGDTAHALIEFPQPIEEALLTLERDKVEAHGRLSAAVDWLKLEKMSATQWKADIPIKADYSPNLTFSVLYVKNGDFHFENAGIQVEQAKVDVTIHSDKEIYEPGDTAELTIKTQVNDQPAEAKLSVGVVDEMIYALQPEIAPDVLDFFYHPRRNNVKTNASLNFISYDLALASLPTPPQGTRSERAVKVLERPRRDNIDTAAWWPNLKTDALGTLKIQFKVPESLTRWRITARAITRAGVVGQKTQTIRSDKSMYVVWSGPRQFRDKDLPISSVIVFNQKNENQPCNLKVSGAAELSINLSLKPGANFVDLPLPVTAEGDLTVQIKSDEKQIDALAINIKRNSTFWSWPQQQSLSSGNGPVNLSLPADAENIRVRPRTPADAWNNVFDSLLNYPYGCVEQTSSRLLPLSLAVQQTQDEAVLARLLPILQTQRLRMVHMASPDARFTWWGDGLAEDPLLTTYAYFADWHASQALQLSLPPEHWNSVLNIYEKAADLPFLHQVLMIWMTDKMKLPVKTQISGLLQQAYDASKNTDIEITEQDSLLLNAPNNSLAHSAADVLLTQMAKAQQVTLPKDWSARLTAALNQLQSAKNPFAEVIFAAYQNANDISKEQLLNHFANTSPTFERALALTMLKLQWKPGNTKFAVESTGWKPSITKTGAVEWSWTNKHELPQTINSSGANGIELLYSSGSSQAKQLPVKIERTLSRLASTDKALEFKSEGVEWDQIKSDNLYLDRITITTNKAASLQYGLLEIPLPPGADVEGTSWGINVRTGDTATDLQPIDVTPYESGKMSYHVPIDKLTEPVTVSHLVRFSTPGKFDLPPVRYWRMYAPNESAFSDEPNKVTHVTVSR